MGDKTGIEWTRGEDGSPGATWNPIVGCSIVSPGCTNCYAMKMAARVEAMARANYNAWREEVSTIGVPEGTTYEPFNSPYAGTTQPSKAGPVWTGKVALASDKTLFAPLRWRRPRKIFVNSMGDLFHESVPDAWIDKVFAIMALAPQHTFQVLTKRARRMREYMTHRGSVEQAEVQNRLAWDTTISVMDLWAPDWKSEKIDGPHRSRAIAAFTKWPLPNVWLGVSAEDQARADDRIPDLLATPAAVRFVSAEPMLGPIDLKNLRQYNPHAKPWINALTGVVTRGGLPRSPSECGFNTSCQIPGELPRLDWIIAGGESGPHARPMHPDWARGLRDQCAAAGVPFFFKQWGEWKHGSDFAADAKAVLNDGRVCEPDRDSLLAADRDEPVPPRRPTMMRRVGKRAAGRLLDGREHNDMPKAIA